MMPTSAELDFIEDFKLRKLEKLLYYSDLPPCLQVLIRRIYHMCGYEHALATFKGWTQGGNDNG